MSIPACPVHERPNDIRLPPLHMLVKQTNEAQKRNQLVDGMVLCWKMRDEWDDGTGLHHAHSFPHVTLRSALRERHMIKRCWNSWTN